MTSLTELADQFDKDFLRCAREVHIGGQRPDGRPEARTVAAESAIISMHLRRLAERSAP